MNKARLYSKQNPIPSLSISHPISHLTSRLSYFRRPISPSALIADYTPHRTVCFTPDAHTAASTRDQRTFLGICRKTRQKALKCLTILTLFRLRLSDGGITEYKMPFDFEKTCKCVEGCAGLGIGPEDAGNARGLSFARHIKLLAFVIEDKILPDRIDRLVSPYRTSDDRFRDRFLFGLIFHNTQHVSGITESALAIRKFLGHEVFLSLFSFQPFVQKRMVEGLNLTKPPGERNTLLGNALLAAFEGWNGRIRAALQKSGLLSILEKINVVGQDEIRRRRNSDRYISTVIHGPCDAVFYLVQQAIHDD